VVIDHWLEHGEKIDPPAPEHVVMEEGGDG
jgi:hypothetical protein